MARSVRLFREMDALSKSDNKNIRVFPKDHDFHILEAQILGPENSPYERGVFKLEIIVSDQYPFRPPSLKFITKVYHPNIDDSGRICLDLIKMPPTGKWVPSINLLGLLEAVRSLLEYPNPDDPLMFDIAEEFKKRNSDFVTKAKQYTEKYAC